MSFRVINNTRKLTIPSPCIWQTISKGMQGEDKLLGVEVHRFLRGWFVDHILNPTKYADKDFGAYLNRRGIY